MKLRTGVLFLFIGSFSLLAQDATELPSAPSTSQQQSQPQKATPAPVQPSAAPTQEAQPPASSKSDETQAAQNQPSQTGPSAPPASGPSEDDSLATIRHTVNEVNVVFTVTDKHGHYVRDLKKDNFKVVDDNKPPAEIRSFRAEANLPLEVGLLVDASNSVRDRFKFEQQAAVEFLNQTIRRKYDEGFVVGFDVTPEVTQDFTDNTELLSIGVRSLRPGGGTAMYDALYFACRDKLLKAQHVGPVRRAIILLTDGEDNQSHVTREEAIEMAQRAEVIVYTISTNITGMKSHGDKVLERIADATGGRAFFPFKVEDVTDAFTQIQDELRSQYALSYRPSDLKRDGAFHSIEIVAEKHKDMHVRARRGYYAPNR